MSLNIGQQIEVASSGLSSQKLENAQKDFERASDLESLKKSARDFESIFIGLMLKSMRESVQKSGFVDGGNAEDIYRSMLDAEYSKTMSQSGDVGLAKTIERQLIRAAGWETPIKPYQEKITPLEKSKGLQAYGGEGLKSVSKSVTIK